VSHTAHSGTGNLLRVVFQADFLDTRVRATYTAILMPALTTDQKPSIPRRVKRRLKRSVKSALDVNRWYYRDAGGEKRPAFYDIDEIYPSLRELDRNYSVIREELDSVLLQRDKLPRYHDLTERERYISGTVDADKDWKVFMLRSLVGKPVTNQKKCPRTTALLEKIPNLYQAFFSILDPGKSIPAHCGPYLGYLRYHLGLVVPKNNPPSMRVKDQIHTWEEGRSIVFDDSWEHEVYNKSDGLRVVLIVDFLRPHVSSASCDKLALDASAVALQRRGKAGNGEDREIFLEILSRHHGAFTELFARSSSGN
jgi:aspartyl/asparaginyl beta-hydroxylase (cupin superfamily)